uniref:Ribosomal protein L32 n=1 Tax=Passiflora suberosa TaxID=133504 RepID=A0A4Y5QDZ9_PASSB|nr:ribosomal protein L32 [Passiflora suberosa]QCX29854.1 ribosomal protein L32 [Passiflora suberosa]
MGVPKKCTSISKNKKSIFEKIVGKKGSWAALKAFSLEKSLSTFYW